jgi:hypothetical protein
MLTIKDIRLFLSSMQIHSTLVKDARLHLAQTTVVYLPDG